MAEILCDQLRGVGIDHVGDLMHRAVFHQVFDDFDAPLGHAIGKFLNRDDIGDRDFTRDLLARLVSGPLLLLPFAVTLQRGKAALTLLFVECVGDGEAPTDAPFVAAARRGGTLFMARVGLPLRLFFLLRLKGSAGGLFGFRS